MNKISREKVLMAKSIKDVSNIYELIAFIWVWRRREFLLLICLIQLLLIFFLLIRYTNIVTYLIKYTK